MVSNSQANIWRLKQLRPIRTLFVSKTVMFWVIKLFTTFLFYILNHCTRSISAPSHFYCNFITLDLYCQDLGSIFLHCCNWAWYSLQLHKDTFWQNGKNVFIWTFTYGIINNQTRLRSAEINTLVVS